LAEPNDTTAMRLADLLDAYVCERTVMPNPSLFNASIVHHGDHNAWNAPWANGRILRGPYADGVLITSRDETVTFGITSADCPTVVLYTERGMCIVLHAGRDSLFDREHALGGKKSRKHASVIDAAMHIMNLYGCA